MEAAVYLASPRVLVAIDEKLVNDNGLTSTEEDMADVTCQLDLYRGEGHCQGDLDHDLDQDY